MQLMIYSSRPPLSLAFETLINLSKVTERLKWTDKEKVFTGDILTFIKKYL